MNRILLISLIGFVLLFISLNLIPGKLKPKKVSDSTTKPTSSNSSYQSANSFQLKGSGQDSQNSPPNPQLAGEQKDPARALEESLIKKSDEARADFSKVTGFTLAGWDNFKFDQLDIGDDSIAGLQGSNPYQGSQVGVLATRSVFAPAEALNFIKSHTHELPGFPKTPVTLTPQPVNQDLARQRGLSSITVWAAENGSSFVAAAYLTRADGKGSYLVTIGGPAENLADNEGFFDKLMMGIRVDSPK